MLVAGIGESKLPPPHAVSLAKKTGAFAIILEVATHDMQRAFKAAWLFSSGCVKFLAHWSDVDRMPRIRSPFVAARPFGLYLCWNGFANEGDVIAVTERYR